MALSPYLRLMRLHQPVGIWLLFWPCAWSIALASDILSQTLYLLTLFLVGSVCMRGAGCIINDILDRRFDAQVERTRTRPLASGELSVKQALALLVVLLLVSFGIALLLGWNVVMYGSLALIPVAIYPLMKRITWWPQAFLGITFNLGALIGWIAVKGALEMPAVVLYIAGLFWTLGYDTIYAHQDKHDDIKIGVKSTALKFGKHTRCAVALFYTLCLALWGGGAIVADANPYGYLPLAIAASLLFYQIWRLDTDDPASCLRMFRLNVWVGAAVFGAFMLA